MRARIWYAQTDMSARSDSAPPAAAPPVAVSQGLAIVVLALLLSIQPVTTDLYLPALPALSLELLRASNVPKPPVERLAALIIASLQAHG